MALFSSNNPKEKQHSGILGAFSVDVIKWEPATDTEASVIVHKFEYEDFPSGSYLIVGPSQMASTRKGCRRSCNSCGGSINSCRRNCQKKESNGRNAHYIGLQF